ARRGRQPGAGPSQSAGFLLMTDDNDTRPATGAQSPPAAQPTPSDGESASAATPAQSAGVEGAAPGGAAPLPAEELTRMTDESGTALKTVYDPEIPADIYELGLIYKVDIADDRAVAVDMTLTTPNCPSAAELPHMVEDAVASVPGVREV